MKQLLEQSRFVSLVAVASLLLASVFTFLLGAIKTLQTGWSMIAEFGDKSLVLVQLIQIIDLFLVATALFIFAVSLYDLFIGKLDLPDWMVAHNLYELKTKLSSVLILVMAVTFLEHLVKWKDAQQTLLFALAIAVVSSVLIAFGAINTSGKS